MSQQILPPDAKRAQEYDNFNYVPSKILRPDGSVVDQLDISVTPTPVVVYTKMLDDTYDPILYLGEALPGSLVTDPVWRIKKMDTTHGVITYWANGAATFVNRWDQHLILTYL